MTTDEYVPSEARVRLDYQDCYPRLPAETTRAEFDRFLARVRRDAYDWGRHDERMSLAYAPPESGGKPDHYPEGVDNG